MMPRLPSLNNERRQVGKILSSTININLANQTVNLKVNVSYTSVTTAYLGSNERVSFFCDDLKKVNK